MYARFWTDYKGLSTVPDSWTVPELVQCVQCPGQGRFCPRILHTNIAHIHTYIHTHTYTM